MGEGRVICKRGWGTYILSTSIVAMYIDKTSVSCASINPHRHVETLMTYKAAKPRFNDNFFFKFLHASLMMSGHNINAL